LARPLASECGNDSYDCADAGGTALIKRRWFNAENWNGYTEQGESGYAASHGTFQDQNERCCL